MATSSSTTESSESSEDTPRWLTATEATEFAAVTYNTIANWVKVGRLHPQRQMRLLPNGQRREVKVFSQAELLKILHRRDPNEHGEVAARAFELFDEGRPLRQVVIALRLTPQRVAELHDEWQELGGNELVITPVAQRELERLLGPFTGVADIVDRVAKLVASRGPDEQHQSPDEQP